MAMSALAIQQFNPLSDEECDARIRAAKEALGERLVILGHHYQREEVFRHADYSGDSLKLSRLAAAIEGAVHRILRRALHGRGRGHPVAPRAGLDPAGSGRRLLHGRHGEPRQGGAGLAGSGERAGPGRAGHARHLHQFRRRSEGVLRAPRRHRLHFVKCRARAGVVVQAAREGAVLPRSAPGPQHGLCDGHPARGHGRCGISISPWAASPKSRSAAQR